MCACERERERERERVGEGESTVSRLIGQYPFLYILLKLFLANPKNIRQTQLMGSLQFDASNLTDRGLDISFQFTYL